MTNPDPDKPTLRSHYRKILAGMSAAEGAEASRVISRGIAGWLQERQGIRILAVFSALPGEPDLRSLHDFCPWAQLAYPLVGPDHRLSFHRVNDPDTLVDGAFGIMEPDRDAHPMVGIEQIDGFFCPGLGFDACGTRLGRGGGFYDRALEGALAGALRVGVCFACQTASPLPRDPHDVVMEFLATEDGVRAITPSPERSS